MIFFWIFISGVKHTNNGASGPKYGFEVPRNFKDWILGPQGLLGFFGTDRDIRVPGTSTQIIADWCLKYNDNLNGFGIS